MNLEAKIAKATMLTGTHTPQDILAAIMSGKMQAWTDEDSLVVTAIRPFPQMKVCDVFLVAGNLEKAWQIHDEQILPWAREQGCQRITGCGRKPWARNAKQHGYDTEYSLVSMEI